MVAQCCTTLYKSQNKFCVNTDECELKTSSEYPRGISVGMASFPNTGIRWAAWSMLSRWITAVKAEPSGWESGSTTPMPMSLSGPTSLCECHRTRAHGYNMFRNLKGKKERTRVTSRPRIPFCVGSVLIKMQSYRGPSPLHEDKARMRSRCMPPMPLRSLGA